MAFSKRKLHWTNKQRNAFERADPKLDGIHQHWDYDKACYNSKAVHKSVIAKFTEFLGDAEMPDDYAIVRRTGSRRRNKHNRMAQEGKGVETIAVKVSAAEKAEQRANNKTVVDQIKGKTRGEGHAKKRVPQVAVTKEYKPHVKMDRVPYVTGDGNPDAIVISRNHGGNVSSPVSAATPYFKGKNGVAALKVRKNPKALFTWQDRIEMAHSVAITGKATVHPRTEVTRHDVDALRPVRAKAKALARSMKAFANVEKRKQAKLAKRAGMTHSPGPVVMKTPKKVVTAEMHLENKRAAVIATKLHRAECMSNTLRHKTAWMERSSPVAA